MTNTYQFMAHFLKHRFVVVTGLMFLLATSVATAQTLVEIDTDLDTDSGTDLLSEQVLPEEPDKYAFEETGKKLTLEDAYRLVLKNNPALRNIDEMIIQADSGIHSAWSMLLPNLMASGQVIRNEKEVAISLPYIPTDPATGSLDFMNAQMVSAVITKKWQSNLGLTANITLFNPRSIPLIQMANRASDKVALEAQIARNDILFAVTASFYQLATLRELIKVYGENQVIAGELLEMTATRFELGQVTELDVMRARMQVTETERQLADAVDAYQAAKRSAALFIGIKEDFVPLVQMAPEEVVLSPEELAKKAMEQRMELDSSRLSVELAEKQAGEVRSRFLPRFDLTGQMNISNSGGFANDKTTTMLIFGANWDLLLGTSRFAELKKRKSEIRVAENNFEQLKIDIQRDVTTRHEEVTRNRRSIDVSEQLLEIANRNYELVCEQYKVGIASSLDLFDASKELATNKVLLELDKMKYILALLTLEKTVGEYNSLSISKE